MTLSSSPALNTRPSRALIFMTSKNAGVTARPPQCAGVAASRIVTDSSTVRAGVESVCGRRREIERVGRRDRHLRQIAR